MIRYVALHQVPHHAVEALLDHAFGTDRHRRTAYAIRGDGEAIPALGFAALDGDRLVGTIQCWPIALIADDGMHPLVMIGPVAVEPDHQQHGIGRQLMHHALDAAAAEGLDDRLMLIGDPEYYGRFFGFTADRTGAWAAPGPVERHRLLARGGAVPACPGMLAPRVAASV